MLLSALLLFLATSAAAKFNTSFEFVFQPASPSFDLFTEQRGMWILDDSTGRVSFSPSSRSSGAFNLSFLCTSLRLYGEAETRATDAAGSPRVFTAFNSKGLTLDVNSTSGARLLAEWTAPELALMNVMMSHVPSVDITIHNVTIDVPFHAQAPSFELWETQASRSAAVADGVNGIGMKTTSFSHGDIIAGGGDLGPQVGADVQSPPKSGDNMILQSMVELHYDVPPGTALLRVHGPSGTNSAWTQHIRQPTIQLIPRCTFLLDPQPAWYDSTAVLDDRLPLAWQTDPRNTTDAILFLVPLDPSVVYSLTVLARNNESVCVISGFKTYPFKFNFAAFEAQKNATRTSEEAGGNLITSNPGHSGSPPSKTGVIVGAVLCQAPAGEVHRRSNRKAAEHDTKHRSDNGRLHNTSGSLIAEVTGNWTKLQPRVLNMWAVKQPSTRLTLHNVTVRVPVRTQATSPELWEKQAKYFPTAKYRAMTVDMTSQGFNSSDLIPDAGRPFWLGHSGETPAVSGDNLVLESLMKLVFTPPPNTSLVRVLGPVGPNIQQLNTTPYAPDQPLGLEERVAVFDYNWPMAWQTSPRNATNTTLFLLPLDPAVQYKVKVLPRNNHTLCAVSGFQTSLDEENRTMTSGNQTADIVEDPDRNDPGTRDKGPNRTAIIAGSVAGAVGALLAVGAAVYLTRRCLVRHRTNPEPGFEVDRGDLDEITPFLDGFLSRVGRSTRTPGKNNVQLASVQTAQNDLGPLSQRPGGRFEPEPGD